MHPAIIEEKDRLVAACRRYDVRRLDIFGSAARADDFDTLRSDADFLVDFSPDTSADHFLDLKDSFERILGRRVDLLDAQAVRNSRNYIRRRRILSEAQPLYVA